MTALKIRANLIVGKRRTTLEEESLARVAVYYPVFTLRQRLHESVRLCAANMKPTKEKERYCRTCDKDFHYLGAASHRAGGVMSIWYGTVKADNLTIDLKASDYDAPHATMYIETDDCGFEFTLDREKWTEVLAMARQFLQTE